MKVKDVVNVIVDEVVVYVEDTDGFVDIYKGIISEIPQAILNMEVRLIGAKSSGVVDIQVK